MNPNDKYCLFNYGKKFGNEIPIGYFDPDNKLHSLIPLDELLFKALSLAERWETEEKLSPGYYQHQIHQHFLVNHYTIPITYYAGLFIFLKKDGTHLYLCTV